MHTLPGPKLKVVRQDAVVHQYRDKGTVPTLPQNARFKTPASNLARLKGRALRFAWNLKAGGEKPQTSEIMKSALALK